MLKRIAEWWDEWEGIITPVVCIVIFIWIVIVAILVVAALFKYVFS